MGILNALRKRLNHKRRLGGENPSIRDYVNRESQLKTAMAAGAQDSASTGFSRDSSISHDSESVSKVSQEIEWSLALVDKEVTEPQTMEEEIKRLKVLSDYFVLDSEREEEFDRITRLGSQIFDVPICLISLVDLGRQWFLSKVGLNATETPRKISFCAHAILNKYKILVVPDASRDFRFKDNPAVTGAPHVRFYAGAALVSPEGYKLGTFCVVSHIARPQGFSESQQQTLHEMAAMVVSAIVARRNRLLNQEYETKMWKLAGTMLETSKNLELSQKMLQSLTTKSGATADLSSVARNLEITANICAATTRSFLADTTLTADEKSRAVRIAQGEEKHEEHHHPEDSFDDGDMFALSEQGKFMREYKKIATPYTVMTKLFENLNFIIPSLPFHGEVTVDIDGSVPSKLVVEDLLLFRSTLNLLTHCMSQSQPTDFSKVGVRMRRMKRDNILLVECLQAGPVTDSSHAKELFANEESSLGRVASMIRSLEGRYGMFLGKWEPNSQTEKTRSIYWFHIPYEAPSKGISFLGKNLQHTHHLAMTKTTGSHNHAYKLNPFEAALLEAGCGGR